MYSYYFQGIGPILLGLLVMKASNFVMTTNEISEGLNISLSTYKDSSVYYRAGDKSSENLEPIFVAISKLNKAVVNETSSESNIINGKINIIIALIKSIFNEKLIWALNYRPPLLKLKNNS